VTEFQLDEVSTQQYYIATKSAPPDDRTRVLKYGQMFAVFDRYGDVEHLGLGEEGVFFEGTRFLSELALFIGNSRPLLLSSTVREDNSVFTADLTNVDITQHDHVDIPRGTLLVTRSKFLYQHVCYEELRISNFGLRPITIPIGLKFNADFADIFEVRGTKRKHHGQMLEPQTSSDQVTLSYRGLDGRTRLTRIECSPEPKRVTAKDFRFEVALRPKQVITYYLTVSCLHQSSSNGLRSYDKALGLAREELQTTSNRACSVHSSNEQFNDWMRRSLADIQMMTVGNPEVGYPYAGVPWFSTVFGRDGIITALECLWATPWIAQGVLRYLAETQARAVIPESDAEPGKILHETRRGEMATLGEVPFGRYYGSVDSTPLFIMLAGAYYERTADLEMVQTLWPNIDLALNWIDRYGDRDGDSFVEYSRYSSHGLVQQGWKDSNDSVFHADGSLADPPIALCEVQGYVYAAKRAAARLAAALEKFDRADSLEAQARDLKTRFEEAFWCDDLHTYALALDGDKKPCRVRASNPGHCLYSKIVTAERAALVTETLLSAQCFNGWGVRTVGSEEARYNPVSYHNGSVWPHDNAIIAAGIARYGRRDLAARLLASFLDVSIFVDLHRLPELFCGLERRAGEGPTRYPVACAPQAWASGAIYMMLEACLGISINAKQQQVAFDKPWLPEVLPFVEVKDLKIGVASVNLAFWRRAEKVQVEVTNRRGDVEILLPQP
jgi:glycogen debranching enzyme